MLLTNVHILRNLCPHFVPIIFRDFKEEVVSNIWPDNRGAVNILSIARTLSRSILRITDTYKIKNRKLLCQSTKKNLIACNQFQLFLLSNLLVFSTLHSKFSLYSKFIIFNKKLKNPRVIQIIWNEIYIRYEKAISSIEYTTLHDELFIFRIIHWLWENLYFPFSSWVFFPFRLGSGWEAKKSIQSTFICYSQISLLVYITEVVFGKIYNYIFAHLHYSQWVCFRK